MKGLGQGGIVIDSVASGQDNLTRLRNFPNLRIFMY